MQFTDAVSVAGTRRTADGYLIAEARSVRTGIQLYAGAEVGRPDLSIVRVYRAADQVFAQDSLQSFSHAPITMDHPAESVTATNWKALSVGEVSTAAKQDGQWVHLPLILKDAAAIQSVEGGKRELSAGYTCELDWTPGTTADGQAFDAQQRSIKVNHLALVDRARAGSEARIGDSQNWGPSPIRDGDHGAPGEHTDSAAHDNRGDRQMALKTIIVDGLPVETTDAGEAAVNKLRGLLDTSAKALETAQADHAKVVAAKDADLGKKDVEIADLKTKVVTDAQLDALVATRATVIAQAKALDAKIDGAGKSLVEIKRAAVAAKLGDAAVKDKADEYVNAAFDFATKDVKTTDAFAVTVSGGLQTNDGSGDRQKAHDAYVGSLQNAWKGEMKGTA